MFKTASALALAAALTLSTSAFADPIKHTDWWIAHHRRAAPHVVYRAAPPVYYAPQQSTGLFGGIGNFLGSVVDGTVGAVVGAGSVVVGGVVNEGGAIYNGAVIGSRTARGQWWNGQYYAAGTGPCWRWDSMQGWVWACS